jgi:hypothetical protein
MIASLVTMIIALRRRIHVSIDVEAFWKSLTSSGLMAAVILLVQAYYYSKYLLPAYIVLGGSIYFLMLLISHAIRAEDISFLDEYLGPHFRFIVRPLESLLARRSRGKKPRALLGSLL